jgi:hypothetical protein
MGLTDLHVAQSAVRCPFCHGSLEVAARDWVVCRACLARHHASCWEGSCASCRSRERLIDPSSRDGAFRRVVVETQIERLDRRWAERRARHRMHATDFQGPFLGGLLGLVVSCIGVAAESGVGAFAGVAVLAASSVWVLDKQARATAGSVAEKAYLARRSELVAARDRLD